MIHFNKTTFDVASLDDELRVDNLCGNLLKDFHQHLLQNGVLPLEAGSMAHGADYFLRDYLVSARCKNLFEEKDGSVRTFAGNWYIISNLEPKLEVLEGHLKGVKEFYRFLFSKGLISRKYLGKIEKECDDISWYGERIEAFWNIQDDGYLAWERGCSLKEG
jgi:hypothetical protein